LFFVAVLVAAILVVFVAVLVAEILVVFVAALVAEILVVVSVLVAAIVVVLVSGVYVVSCCCCYAHCVTLSRTVYKQELSNITVVFLHLPSPASDLPLHCVQ